jgi:subtilisin family serine protease
VSKIAANKAWAKGHKGQGVVVANIDTGVRYTHEALVGSYRGNKGGSFDHDYSWFDPEQKDKVPTDGNGHGTAIFVVNLIGAGTHTMGTIAGSEASGVGVAPSAKWIAAKGCSTSSCSTFSLTKSAEWVGMMSTPPPSHPAACPTRVDGTNPDCSKVPDVVNNSWGGSLDPPRQQLILL